MNSESEKLYLYSLQKIDPKIKAVKIRCSNEDPYLSITSKPYHIFVAYYTCGCTQQVMTSAKESDKEVPFEIKELLFDVIKRNIEESKDVEHRFGCRELNLKEDCGVDG